jgi:alkaline phosphatase
VNLKPLLLGSCVAIAVSACSNMPQTASSQNHLIAPQAKGQLDQFSGATRLTKERSEALKASIDSHHVKHVILFIGDGTSDSEITIARNYVEGV